MTTGRPADSTPESPLPSSVFEQERKNFHAGLLASILTVDSAGIASNADRASRISRDIAGGIAEKLQWELSQERGAGQTAGSKFETLCANFVRATFLHLGHLRPGHWTVRQLSARNRMAISGFEQYAHLKALDDAARRDPALAAALGSDYTIAPDLVIIRRPESDAVINQSEPLVDDMVGTRAAIRASVNPLPLLHASLSCKWTLRSDRAQNARAEALNLIRNRKGRLPHVAVITAEPLPSRLASIALGTGDIDCVYHFALYELQDVIRSLDYPDADDMLNVMVDGGRLKDISDLPLDLAT